MRCEGAFSLVGEMAPRFFVLGQRAQTVSESFAIFKCSYLLGRFLFRIFADALIEKTF
jgi:hypothetical protein